MLSTKANEDVDCLVNAYVGLNKEQKKQFLHEIINP